MSTEGVLPHVRGGLNLRRRPNTLARGRWASAGPGLPGDPRLPAVAAGLARRLVWAVVLAGLTAAPAAALGPAPPDQVSRLWSRYPAGEQRVQMSPGPAPAQPEPPAPPRAPARAPEDNRSEPPQLVRAPAASESRVTTPKRRLWLLGAGVGIALGIGLLVLLVLGLVALKARPGARRPARAAPASEAGRSGAATPAEKAAPPSPSTPPAPRPRATPAERNGVAPPVTHLLLVPTPGGYSLIQSGGEVPAPGTPVNGAALPVEGEFVVARVGPSPLPLDPRRCAYLERSHA